VGRKGRKKDCWVTKRKIPGRKRGGAKATGRRLENRTWGGLGPGGKKEDNVAVGETEDFP